MKKRNGFTLVELLAVIVILAIILVIAVPQILKTIDAARLGAFRSTAKLVISQAERQYMVDQALNAQSSAGTGTGSATTYIGVAASTSADTCGNLTELSANDYNNCKVTVTKEGVATLNLEGKGKFNGYNCSGATKGNVDTDSVCSKTVTVSSSDFTA